MNVSAPASAKTARPKARRFGAPSPQGFIRELDALSDDKTATSSQTNPAAAESTSSAEHGVAVFCLEAPTAQTVKLAADFTGWDKNPLDLQLSENGSWQITVALPPGRYAYRFLVDGEWHDDPQCMQCEANPFGTTNAVVEVV
jgi:1,4-alpha-glucan branching enzyme